jgi:hypothetical protein
MNNEVLLKLAELEIKLQKLVKEHNALKEELNTVRAENKELKALKDRQNEDLKNFQNQDKISKIVSSIAEDTQKSTELKLKINEYIKEIDKCIAHLSE